MRIRAATKTRSEEWVDDKGQLVSRLVRYVALPTYKIVSFNADGTAIVEVPDDETTRGVVDESKIRTKYRDNPTWDREGATRDAEPPQEAPPRPS